MKTTPRLSRPLSSAALVLAGALCVVLGGALGRYSGPPPGSPVGPNRALAAPPAQTATSSGIDVVRVYSAARDSVVNITTSPVPPGSLRQPADVPAGTGTGVVVDPRGFIL